ncbi:MAG: TlpA family protein disulfide reductase [Fermentimonas sp.]|jgi:thiol-disulfide isomerase/thioredoxin
MKTKTILTLLLIAVAITGCNRKQVNTPPMFAGEEFDQGEKAIITGKISNRDVYPHVRWLEIKLLDFGGNETTHLSPITEDGMFRFDIYPITTREISFVPVEDRIVIAPGDSLYIEKDFKNIAHTVFGGTCAELNKQISAFRNKYLGRYTQPYELPYMDFKAAAEKQYEETLHQLAAFQQEHNTSKTFNTWAKKQVALDYYIALFDFPFRHFLRTNNDLKDNKLGLYYDFVKKLGTYYDFVKDFEKEEDNSIIMASYFEAVNQFSKYLFTQVQTTSWDDMLEKLKSATENSYLSQFAVANFVNNFYLKANKTDWIDSNRTMINKMITDPFLRTTLDNRYNQVKAYNDNPRIYSDAVLGKNAIELHGSGSLITDSANVMKHIVDSNPGQVLYVDVWAPWCRGSVMEMPDSKKLQDCFEGKPITFVYLCMGGTPEAQQEVINKYDLTGIHHFLSDKEWQDIVKRFNMKSTIPYYLLFDKNGVMVDFGLHLRPSFPETKVAIEKLLEQ